MSDAESGKQPAADPELDDLLNSALQDLTMKNEPPKEGDAVATDNDASAPPNMWSEEFIKEAAAQFESNMAAILGSFGGVPEDQITQEQIAQTFTKMAEAAAQVMQPLAETTNNGQTPALAQNPPPVQQENLNEVTAAIAQTIQSLSSNTDNLQAPFTDQDFASMFNNFNLDGAGQEGGANMFVPFMQGMMQSLLSKEVLYPSLKDLVDKYPAWLEDNKGKVEEADLERYKKQQELMVKVCAELEQEQESDPEDVRRKRFELVLDLMQQMQDLGQPPTELVGEIGVPPQGFAAPVGIPGQDNAQCSLM